jgi:hypothetical protein
MENKVVTLKIESNLNSITKDVKKLGNTFEDTADEIKGIQQSTKSAESGVKSLADGFKGMGLAIKAIGIGLVMEAFNLFKEVLGKNQKVVDGFNTVIGALSIAFNDLFGFVFDNFPTVIKIFKDVFENPTTYLKKFGDLVKENLIERFNSFLDTIGYVGESIKKVFEGDFAGAMESVKKAGKESLDVLTGVNNSFDRGKKIVGDAADAIGNYAIKTLKASEANINLQNSALIAAAEQAKLVEQYDAEAEKLRKIRDNDLLSVKDRIKANDDLKKVLENQSNAMKSFAAKQEEAAQATYNLNKSTENQVALINAQGNALGVVAQIEGLTSEQEANRVSLKKELNELDQTKLENINALTIEQNKFNETLENDELKKLENQRLNLEEEKRIELLRLQDKINKAAEGTKAKLDAENEYAIKTQEIDNALTTNKKAIADEEIKIEKAKADQKKAIQDAEFALASGAVNFLKEIGGKSKAIQKAAIIAENAIGIGKMIIANNAANIGALATPQAIASSGVSAIPVIAMNNITTALGVATTIAATAKALSAVGGGSAGSAGSVGGGGMSAPAAPSFNVVGASSTNQLAQTIGLQQQQPIKAYVVANDVTTQQGLDRNIVQSASIG